VYFCFDFQIHSDHRQRYGDVNEITMQDWNRLLESIISHHLFTPLNAEQYEDLKKILEECTVSKPLFYDYR